MRGRREATGIYELLDLYDDATREAVEANRDQFAAIADQIGIESAVDSCEKLEHYVDENPLDRVAARILFIMQNFGIYAAQGR